MKNRKSGSPAPSELRKRAEKALREAPARTTPAGATEPDQPSSSHELTVHQIELEMQNEELERANAETARLLAEFCDLYDFAPVGYFTLDTGGVIRKANLAGAALLGAPRVALAGRRLAPFLSPESYREFANFLASVMSGRQGLTCEVNLRRKGGGTARVHLGGKAFEEVPECRVTMVDVTEQARAEQELRDARWRLESIIEGTRVGTWEWNVQTGETVFNEVWARLVGRTLDELAPVSLATWTGLAHPEDLVRSAELLERHFAGELPYYDCECRMKHRDGHWVWVHDRGRVVTRTTDGKPLMMFGTHADISERKRADDALRTLHAELEQRVRERTSSLTEANRELDAYSYSVSHELRTPLRAIDGFSARIAHDYRDLLDGEGRRLFEQVRWNAQRMGQLIDDLLAFSQAGRAHLHIATVDMAGAARAALAEVLPDPAHLGRISLSVGELPEARGDAILLRRVWANLLSNAVKFSAPRERPEIHVEGRAVEGETVYSVRDNGVGFDMKHVDKLFGVFQRLYGLNEFEGTGVGLALVRRIVTRHGGRAWAEGALNEGATFFFTLGPC